MKPLTMTESEIRMRYRDGASAQILADLNACGWDRIKKIVGEPVEVKDNKPRGHIDEKRARDLHAEGKTDKEMAEELKVSRGAVALWRSRRGFEANKKEESVMEMNKKTPETTEDAGQVIEEVGKCFEEVEPEETEIQLTPRQMVADLYGVPRGMLPDSEITISTDGCGAIGHYKKPPLGVMPRYIWDEKRRTDIGEAIVRHIEAGAQLPAEWVIEWNERCEG